MRKNYLRVFLRVFLIAIGFNLLVGCVNAQGETVSVFELIFGGDTESVSPFSALLTTVGSIIGGPYGWAAGIIGTAVPAFIKAKKKNNGIAGVVIGVQAGRAALSPEQRKKFDNTAREAMNEIKKGDPRGLIRKAKVKLKKAGKILKARLSDKHILMDAAKKSIKKLL